MIKIKIKTYNDKNNIFIKTELNYHGSIEITDKKIRIKDFAGYCILGFSLSEFNQFTLLINNINNNIKGKQRQIAKENAYKFINDFVNDETI